MPGERRVLQVGPGKALSVPSAAAKVAHAGERPARRGQGDLGDQGPERDRRARRVSRARGGPESEILVERSEFAANGFDDGQSHNMCIVSAKSVTLRASYSHHARVGHNVKSTAAITYILDNRIMDEVGGSASCAIHPATEEARPFLAPIDVGA